ncbi:MAG: 23S rRNA (adenine(2503)-C(2))-methyltransferase RlmN [Candidatus Competibacterales bacterium]|nr:23S rRNA (adenine(2503)-C(2))-methyltransferase RlmN [Candidatus Competibacterales bacterium]
MTKVNLLDLDRAALEAFFHERGERRFRAEQLMKWLYHEGVTDFDAMTNLGKALRTALAEQAELRLPRVLTDRESRDGTRKWLIQLEGGNCIETVFIPEDDRGTLCVSSQVGCILDCTFCATARQGFNRNLSTAEIVGQVWLAHQALGGGRAGSRRITNIVLMGMGEPLYNFRNVVPALNLMQDDLAFGLSKRRVTLSTSGVVPQIYKLREVSDVSLAVSLHAPDDALRNRLVPLNRRYPLAELIPACRAYIAGQAQRRITWEYVMLDGVNDGEDHARALVRLLGDIPSKVNLIPFNPFPEASYRRSPPAVIDRFRQILTAHGLTAVTRKTRGEDIDAACGQLAGQVSDRSRRTLRQAI